jgi:TetR/AcrR family transcriptional regulator, mexJK operon transcriptional repressor
MTDTAPCDTGPIGTELMEIRSPGRPKNLEKREAILDAAERLFAERGFDGVAIEAIAAASCVSKVTIYSNFGDKGAIFEEIVKRETERLAHDIADVGSNGTTLQDRLTRFGVTLVATFSQPCHIALDKSVGLAAQNNPGLAARFFAAGPGRVRDLLAQILADAAAKGEITVEDPRAAAEDLLSLWLGFRTIERRFLVGKAMTQDEYQSRVSRSVAMFLRGMGAPEAVSA